jgi:predicted NBD/HSP70 family sugar kinase
VPPVRSPTCRSRTARSTRPKPSAAGPSRWRPLPPPSSGRRNGREFAAASPLGASFADAALGDPVAQAIVREEATLIAKALTSIIAVIDPDLIVLGGGVGRAPGFAAEVGIALEMLAPVVPEIRVSALGDDAVVEGCLAAGMERAWHRVLERS